MQLVKHFGPRPLVITLTRRQAETMAVFNSNLARKLSVGAYSLFVYSIFGSLIYKQGANGMLVGDQVDDTIIRKGFHPLSSHRLFQSPRGFLH